MVLMWCDWCWLVGMVRSCVVLCFAWTVLACVALFMFFTGGINLSLCNVQVWRSMDTRWEGTYWVQGVLLRTTTLVVTITTQHPPRCC